MNFCFSSHPRTCTLFRIICFLSIFLSMVCPGFAEWEYQRIARILHNNYRGKHSSRSLYTTKDLNRRAEQCAKYYVRLGSIDHSCPYVYNGGENIYANWGGRHTDAKITIRSIDSWYAEEKFYRYRGNRQSGTGHFTQMVWRNTRAMGFGVARSRNMIVAVGIYWPAGNYRGEYAKNVWRPYRRKYYGYY